MNFKCNMVNMVWVDRGIILTIIKFITKFYGEIMNKNIYIENDMYRNIISKIFRNMSFTNKVGKNTFYFNIRKIIKKQDIVIDHIKNNIGFINGSSFMLVPYYDNNDPLIAYKYSKKDKKDVNLILKSTNSFSRCGRGNYNNTIWDFYIEYYIINKYCKFFNNSKCNNVIKFINSYLNHTYFRVRKYKYVPIYFNMGNNSTEKKCPIHEKKNCPECPECKENNIKQPSEDKPKSATQKCPDNKQNYINIIRLLTNKINILNDIMTNK